MTTQSLSHLLAGIQELTATDDRPVSGITLDSRQVQPGDVFCAWSGNNSDGRHYIEQAIQKGAKAVLAEADSVKYRQPYYIDDVPIIPVKDLDLKVGYIAANFYDHPSQELPTVGVTGTNGKTSLCSYIAQALAQLNKRCGVIGTLGSGFVGDITPGSLTTPDAISVQKHFAEFVTKAADVVAMEVSSHALAQKRVAGVHFNIGVFTNLTRDHLDYHGDMANYGAAKKQLFLQPGLQYAVINVDDHFGRELLTQIPDGVKVYGYSVYGAKLDIPLISLEQVEFHPDGFSAKVVTPWGNCNLTSSLMGRFNVSNLLASLTVLALLEVPLEQASKVLGQVKQAEGRMETFGGNGQPKVVVDYAHTPDALQQALLALREHCNGQLWCVFGCGGDRDRGKRAEMGQIAERYSNHVILTSDNPRNEIPSRIVEDIKRGMASESVVTELDRAKAIAKAIDLANEQDIVIIAGKGHEKFQIIKNEKHPFSDTECVIRCLAS